MKYTVEGVNIYTGEVDWSYVVEAQNEETATFIARQIVQSEMPAIARQIDLRVVNSR